MIFSRSYSFGSVSLRSYGFESGPFPETCDGKMHIHFKRCFADWFLETILDARHAGPLYRFADRVLRQEDGAKDLLRRRAFPISFILT